MYNMHVVKVGESVWRKPFRSSTICPVIYPSRAWLTSWLGSVKLGLHKYGSPVVWRKSPYAPRNRAFVDFSGYDKVFLYISLIFLLVIQWHFPPPFQSTGLNSTHRQMIVLLLWLSPSTCLAWAVSAAFPFNAPKIQNSTHSVPLHDALRLFWAV